MIQMYQFRVQGKEQVRRALELCREHQDIFSYVPKSKKQKHNIMVVTHENSVDICMDAQNYVQFNVSFKLKEKSYDP